MRFLPLFLFLLLARTGFAAPLPAFEGTITQTQNGISTRAKIAWQPPQSLQIAVEADPDNGVAARTLLTRGEETFLIWPDARRVQRYPFNMAKAWWRGSNLQSGGPANFLFAATPFPTNPQEGRFLRRDEVLFGGGGRNAYYAAIKTPARRFAAQIAVSPASRIEKDDAAQIISQSVIALDAQNLPKSVEVVEGGTKTTFVYNLKPAAAPLILPALPYGIWEDTELKAPSAYTLDDASSLFNRGVSLAANENFPAALAAWEQAAAKAPESPRPWIAIFESAFATRDLARARLALDKLAPFETNKPLDLFSIEMGKRRVRFALATRDLEGAAQIADATFILAQGPAAVMRDLSLGLLRAEIARSRGDIAQARELWRAVLSSSRRDIGAQISAAQSYAFSATREELAALLKALPGQTDAQKLARALIQLRDEKTPETAEFADDALQISLALGFEAAARDDDAAKAWETLLSRGDDGVKSRARVHLMTLAARRGEVSQSLAQWRAWNASLGSRSAREGAQITLIEAWEKAFRGDQLRLALANRVAATGASEDEARLFWTFQNRTGSDEEVAAALENGLARFPDSAFWMGKKAETLIARANGESSARRQQLYGEALSLLDKAVENAPDEPFYRFQRSLAATQRAAKLGMDASVDVGNRARAQRETENLLAALPDDPDALVAAAVQNLSFDGEKFSLEAVRLAQLALDTAPGDGDRHTLIWAARQSLALALARLKRFREAAAQWEFLLQGARSAADQSALAGGYFALLETNKDGDGMAQLLTRLAGETWTYSASRALLEAASARAADSPLAVAISGALAKNDDPAATLAAATLANQRLSSAQRALQAPDAPAIADANLKRATLDVGATLEKLRGVADGPNRYLAARAAAFLAENAELPDAQRLTLLRRAIAIEPRDAALRFALVGALDGEEAATQRRNIATTLDFDLETRRQLVNAARKGGDATGALFIAEEAFAIAARGDETGTNSWQRLAFSLAKTAFEARQTPRALELYNGLILPQWSRLDRAAALGALYRNYQVSGQTEAAAALGPKIKALELNPQQLQGAIGFVDEVEN